VDVNIPHVSDLVADGAAGPLAFGILAALLVLIVMGRPWGRAGAVTLLLLALVWIPFNKPIEGPTLIEFTDERGLTLADMLTLFAVPLAALRFWGASKSERTSKQDLSVNQML
jgi:hypothetical protein